MNIAIIDECNQCSFMIKFEDISQSNIVKECMINGLSAWYQAANPEKYKNKYFNEKEIESFYWAGYSEPTMELLKRNNIKAKCLDVIYDKDNKIKNANEVIYY